MNVRVRVPMSTLRAARAGWTALLEHPLWPLAALALIGVALLVLLGGWWMPELWRGPWTRQRPVALALVGVGALMMWMHERHRGERLRREGLSRLSSQSLSVYESAPNTLPMALPDDAIGGDEAMASHEAPDDELPPHANGATPEAGAANRPAAPPAAYGVIDIPLAEPDAATPPTQASEAAAEQEEARGADGEAAGAWSLPLLRSLEWRRLEALCEALFEQDGYIVQRDPDGHDSGISLRLHTRLDPVQPARIVHCRPWQPHPIGVAPVRAFLGTMVDAERGAGMFVSAAEFAPEADRFARRHGIVLVDGRSLLTQIARRPPDLQQQLMAVATEGEYMRPSCPGCGRKMHRHPGADDAHPLWVCDGTPACAISVEWRAEGAG